MNSKQLLLTTFICISNSGAVELHRSDTAIEIKEKLNNKQDTILYEGSTYKLAKVQQDPDTMNIHYTLEKPITLFNALLDLLPLKKIIVAKDIISIHASTKHNLNNTKIENPKRVYNRALVDLSVGTVLAAILIFIKITKKW